MKPLHTANEKKQQVSDLFIWRKLLSFTCLIMIGSFLLFVQAPVSAQSEVTQKKADIHQTEAKEHKKAGQGNETIKTIQIQ